LSIASWQLRDDYACTTSILPDSVDALRDACVDFAKSEGYVINQRHLDKKEVDCGRNVGTRLLQSRAEVVSGCIRLADKRAGG
jgi:hypothetical protein